jgi:hypothetical protein
MKYTVFISLFAGCTAFAPITRKTSAAACSPFAAPKKYNSIVCVPAVVHKTSSTALCMDSIIEVTIIAGLVSIFSGLFSIFGSYLLIKNDIKGDVDKGFAAIGKDLLALKEASEKNFNELKTEFQGLKTDVQGLKADLSAVVEKKINASEKNFKDLKTDVVSRIGSSARNFSLRLDAQDKLIEANGLKIDGRLLAHKALCKNSEAHASKNKDHCQYEAHDQDIDAPEKGIEASNPTINLQEGNNTPEN